MKPYQNQTKSNLGILAQNITNGTAISNTLLYIGDGALASNKNTFSNLKQGIQLERCKARVVNNEFNNILDPNGLFGAGSGRGISLSGLSGTLTGG